MTVFFINPFAFAAADGDYESIATVTVGSGGASSIEFTSIPGTYQHLQLRMILRDGRSQNENIGRIRFNGATGSVYSRHRLYGDGAAASADGDASQTGIESIGWPSANATANAFGATIIDILDYASTTKNKTLRSMSAYDRNGGGYVWLGSGLWQSTSAITSIAILPSSTATISQHSTAALYGIKAP